MKKILWIVVLGLLIFSKAFSEEIIIQKWKSSKLLSFELDDSKIFIEKEFSNKKTIIINSYVHVLMPAKINDNLIKEHFNLANKVWKQANIYWDLKLIQRVKPGISWSKFKKFYKDYCELPSLRKCFKEVYPKALRRTTKMNKKFVDLKTNKKKDGVNIYYMPDNSVWYTIGGLVMGDPDKNNYNNDKVILLPAQHLGGSPPGSFMVEDFRVLAHELGHILDLRYDGNDIHSSNPKDIMYIGQSSNVFLSKKDSIKARKNAKITFKIK